MFYGLLGNLAILVPCGVLFLIGYLRRWAVPLWAAVLVGIAVRVTVACSREYTPGDVLVHFQQAGQDVWAGQDPLTHLRRNQWNFLPLMPYLFGLELHLGLPWWFASKIVPVLADVAVIALVARLARDGYARRLPLLYALCPVAILISAMHGQVEPVALAFGLGALVLARRWRAGSAGVLGGVAVAAKTWPVVLLVGVLRDTPIRRWWRVALGAALVPLVMLLSSALLLNNSVREVLRVMGRYRSYIGEWGWTGVRYSRSFCCSCSWCSARPTMSR